MQIIKTKESDIQKTVCEYLARRKHFFWRQNTVGVYDAKNKTFRKKPKYALNGIPDIIVLTEGGYAVFLEIKNKRGVQSADQREFQARCEDIGAEYYIIRKLEDVINIGL